MTSLADSLRKLHESDEPYPWLTFCNHAANLWPLLCNVVEAAEGIARSARTVDLQAAHIQGGAPYLPDALSVLADATQEPA